MPHKFNDARRDKFPKAKYRGTNCSEYNESLRQRGDVTIWVSDDVVKKWVSPRHRPATRYTGLLDELSIRIETLGCFPAG